MLLVGLIARCSAVVWNQTPSTLVLGPFRRGPSADACPVTLRTFIALAQVQWCSWAQQENQLASIKAMKQSAHKALGVWTLLKVCGE